MNNFEVLIQQELLPAAKKVYTGNEKQIFGKDILPYLSSQWTFVDRWFCRNGTQIIRIDTLKKRLKDR